MPARVGQSGCAKQNGSCCTPPLSPAGQVPTHPAPALAPAPQLVHEKSSALNRVEPGMQAVHVVAPWARLVSRPAGQRMHVLAA